jgi:hypothetical protein
LQTIEKQLAGESGSKLDVYELDVTHEKSDALQDLAELQLATVCTPYLQLASRAVHTVRAGIKQSVRQHSRPRMHLQSTLKQCT